MKNKKRISYGIVAILVLVFSLILTKVVMAQLIGTVVAVTGSVLDATTNEPVTALVIVLDENGKKVNQTRSNAAENGTYYLPSLKPGKKYTINISKPNYFNEKHELEIANTDKYDEISRDFLIKPKDKGIKIPMPVPPFEINQTKLRFGADEILLDLKNTLVNNPEVKFQILCYPDNNLDKGKNKTVTEERCKSIENFFTANGIDASRMTIQGSQSTDPKNPPPTQKMAKGKRYIGPTYIVVTDF